MALELFEGGSVLISDITSSRQFKVNDHCLKPYLTSGPPAPADMVNLHLLEVHKDVTTVSPSPPIGSRRFY